MDKKEVNERANIEGQYLRDLSPSVTRDGTIRQAGFKHPALKPAKFDKHGQMEKEGLKPLETDIPEQSAHLLHENPCVRAFGPCEGWKTCGQCRHAPIPANVVFEWKQGKALDRPEIACAFRQEAGYERLSWPPDFMGCAKWEAKPEPDALLATEDE